MNNKGFTFFEVLITLSLITILALLSTTNYSPWLRKNEQQVIEDELISALHFAKIQARILNQRVYITTLEDSCNWDKGFVLSIYDRKTKNTKHIHEWRWHHPRWHLSWKGIHASNKIIFSPDPKHAVLNGHFTLLNKDTLEGRIIILNRLGRIRREDYLSSLS